MQNQILRNLLVASSIIGFTSAGWGQVKVVSEKELSKDCSSIGYFESNAGYGRSLNGPQVALYRALKKASNAGASHAVVKELNRGSTDQNGYSLVEGFTCTED